MSFLSSLPKSHFYLAMRITAPLKPGIYLNTVKTKWGTTKQAIRERAGPSMNHLFFIIWYYSCSLEASSYSSIQPCSGDLLRHAWSVIHKTEMNIWKFLCNVRDLNETLKISQEKNLRPHLYGLEEEELNLHVSNIGERLTFEIPSSNVEPESYLEPTKNGWQYRHGSHLSTA